MKSPKAPKPTAQDLAVQRRQSAALDEEIAEQEERSRALTRGRLGTASLLGGVPNMRAGSRASTAKAPMSRNTRRGSFGGLMSGALPPSYSNER